jgi:ribose transport system ATP-binding protein
MTPICSRFDSDPFKATAPLQSPSGQKTPPKWGRLGSYILDLSGGNQQKALVAEAPIILLDDPTRGVDVAAKRDFYQLAAAIARAGKLIVWHSTEDLEFLECDRVLVFAHGRIVAELRDEEITEQAIVAASFSRASERSGAGAKPGASVAARALSAAAPFLSLIVVLAIMMAENSRMASVFGLDLLLWAAVPVALVAIGQTFVVGGSEIDLGIGAFAGLVNVLSATWLVDSPLTGVAAMGAGLVAYAGLGALIQLRRIPAIVVTLGASFIWSGVAYTLQPTPGGSSPDWLTAAVGWSIPHVPTTFVVLALIGAAAFAIDRTPFGVTLRAFGGNPTAMERAGWSAPKYAALRYLLAGLFGLLAGLALTAINTASDYNAGGAYTLLSVAAVVVGGCSLAGGEISPLGVVAGSVTLSLIGAQGALLVLILALKSLSRRREA